MRKPHPRASVDQVVSTFSQASALMDAIRLRYWDAAGLTVTQLRLLAFVAEEPGLSNADLADRLYVTRPSVSALLDRLERGGFLRREISVNDRRGISIWLEERGRNIVDTIGQEGYDYVCHLVDGLSDPELNQLTSAFELLIRAGSAVRAKDLQADRAQP
ncbi:MAG: MarR family winged helix-turn-helix transcriptional regulator [Dehalococcoidia bacterium]